MINEGQVALQWQRLFSNQKVTPECLELADELIEQLRSESPLRFRLAQELQEIRQLESPETNQVKPRKRKTLTKKT
jgi:hypothetical protein